MPSLEISLWKKRKQKVNYLPNQISFFGCPKTWYFFGYFSTCKETLTNQSFAVSFLKKFGRTNICFFLSNNQILPLLDPPAYRILQHQWHLDFQFLRPEPPSKQRYPGLLLSQTPNKLSQLKKLKTNYKSWICNIKKNHLQYRPR